MVSVDNKKVLKMLALIALEESGVEMSDVKIAESLGVTRQTVFRWRRDELYEPVRAGYKHATTLDEPMNLNKFTRGIRNYIQAVNGQEEGDQPI